MLVCAQPSRIPEVTDPKLAILPSTLLQDALECLVRLGSSFQLLTCPRLDGHHMLSGLSYRYSCFAELRLQIGHLLARKPVAGSVCLHSCISGVGSKEVGKIASLASLEKPRQPNMSHDCVSLLGDPHPQQVHHNH
jgi:hypothetical protein